MAKPKKGQLAQFMVPLVDATDFASVESAITESDFNSGATVKFFGVNHGVSTAYTSGTVSKAGRLVRSGLFQITLKGTENNYDEMVLRINKTGCAEQIVTWENTDNDDSDIMSALTVIQSMASDAASAAAQANSRVLLNQSRISDVYSLLSDLDSNFQSRVPKAVATNSQLSDLSSDLRSYLVGISASVSDVQSALSDAQSDLASKIGAITASVSASDISDIASAVKVILASDLSDILSAAQQTNSRVLVNQSRVSDIQSALSDAHSDLASKIGNVSVTITASDISDIASAVVAGLPIASTVSDIYSLLSDLNSQFHSRIPKEPAARSQLSDLASDLGSRVDIGVLLTTLLASDVSDATSAARQANSRVLVNQSTLSDVYSLLSDLHSDVAVMSGVVSDVYSNLAAGVGVTLSASDISDIASAVWARSGADRTTVPAVTAGMGAKFDWLFALSRNKLTQTATQQKLYDDDGNAVASATISDDGTTYTRNGWGD